MTQSASCPPRATILAYLAGEIPDAAEESVAGHLARCSECALVVADIDAWNEQIEQQLRLQPAEEDQSLDVECRQALFSAKRCAPLIDRSLQHVEIDTATITPSLGRIGRYRIVRLIGRGGMGAVYEAVTDEAGERVALKLLPGSLSSKGAGAARFQREIQTLSNLSHPHIVLALDSGELDGSLFLAMELIDGCDLARIVDQHGPLSIADACEVGRQAALGLHCIHEHGYVHRDVKPSNLMLSRSGIVKVADLGLALVNDWRQAEFERLTETGHLLGTIGYLAPEQATQKTVTPRADLFGLGSTLFKLLTKRSPMDRPGLETPLQRLAALNNYKPPDLSEWARKWPPELTELIGSLLAGDPNQRPASAALVANKLSPLARGHRLLALAEQAIPLRRPDGDDRPTLTLGSTRSPRRLLPRDQKQRWLIAMTLILLAIAVGALLMPPFRKGSLPTASDVASKTPVAVDRQLAEEVLAIGGTIDIAYNDDSFQLSPGDPLPKQDFRLEWIMLTSNPHVDDQLLQRISSCQHVTGLTLQHTNITDRGVKPLGQLRALSVLMLYGAPITDDGLEAICRLPNLNEVVLSDTRITDVTLQRLSHLRNLELLHLKGTPISDEGLQSIGKIMSLRSLDLRDTDVTETGLMQLHGLTRLKEIAVDKDALSSAAAARLQASLPDCQVELAE